MEGSIAAMPVNLFEHAGHALTQLVSRAAVAFLDSGRAPE